MHTYLKSACNFLLASESSQADSVHWKTYYVTYAHQNLFCSNSFLPHLRLIYLLKIQGIQLLVYYFLYVLFPYATLRYPITLSTICRNFPHRLQLFDMPNTTLLFHKFCSIHSPLKYVVPVAPTMLCHHRQFQIPLKNY